jgi:hypothetical protein
MHSWFDISVEIHTRWHLTAPGMGGILCMIDMPTLLQHRHMSRHRCISRRAERVKLSLINILQKSERRGMHPLSPECLRLRLPDNQGSVRVLRIKESDRTKDRCCVVCLMTTNALKGVSKNGEAMAYEQWRWSLGVDTMALEPRSDVNRCRNAGFGEQSCWNVTFN